VSTADIETPRLRLSPLCLDDLDDLIELYADPEVMRGSSGIARARTREESTEWLSQALAGGHKPWHRIFRVESRIDRSFVGRIGLRPDESGLDAEIAYAFARAAWGRGLATEAAAAVLDWATGAGMRRLAGCVLVENTGSQRVLEKIGMKKTGERSTTDGDLVLYELHKSDQTS